MELDRGIEREREKSGERGTAITITVNTFSQWFQFCHMDGQAKVSELGPAKEDFFHALLTVTRTVSKKNKQLY